MSLIYIVIGGGIGALLRYFTSQFVNNIFNKDFSLGTVFVNCVGALLIGFLINIFDPHGINTKLKLLIITGFLGGYTTFSTYSFETVNYFLNGNIKYGILNIVLNNILCIFFVLLGLWLNKLIFTKIS